MRNFLFILFVVLAWVLSMVNTSGLGIAYNTPAKTNILILIWCLLLAGKNNFIGILRTNPVLVFFTVISFIILPLLTASSWEGLSYLMMVPLVYCFAHQKVTDLALQLSGYIVAGLGLFILYVYSRTSILSGWNDNHISMIALFSYIYFSVSLYGKMSGRKLTIGILVTALYVVMMNVTNSRGSIIFIVFSIALAYNGSWLRKFLTKRNFLFYALNIPLIISFIFILFPNLMIFEYFDDWSLKYYGKSAFNGRDELWREAYNRLFDSYLLGEGEFLINHHNSAVAVISVFGVIGYICWYKIFVKPLQFLRKYIQDNLVFGLISAFLLIFWQQSFELGFVCASPNMIPYVILGLGLSRARDLKDHRQLN